MYHDAYCIARCLPIHSRYAAAMFPSEWHSTLLSSLVTQTKSAMATNWLFLNLKRAIRLFGEHSLKLIFKLKCDGWLTVCVCHYFSVERWPLSVHLVKGLSAAGVEVESERAAEFRLHLKSVCLWVHVDGRGAVQLVREERRGEAEMEFMQLPRWYKTLTTTSPSPL